MFFITGTPYTFVFWKKILNPPPPPDILLFLIECFFFNYKFHKIRFGQFYESTIKLYI